VDVVEGCTAVVDDPGGPAAVDAPGWAAVVDDAGVTAGGKASSNACSTD